MPNLEESYKKYYAKTKKTALYPVEFVVRSFLGSYPNLNLSSHSFEGKRVLDLGFGDGRNIPFLNDLGFEVFGVEISDEIINLSREKLDYLGYSAILKKGHNSLIPFEDYFFDCIVACHSCYYVREHETFEDNLNEISRSLKSNGLFIASLPFIDTYILKGAIKLANQHYRIVNDPYSIRKNSIFKAFKNEEEIKGVFERDFKDLRIGYCCDNFYGIEQKVWLITCWKK